MSRLAEQSVRLDVGHYPARFGYRIVYSDMDANRHVNNGTFGRLFEEGRVDLHQRVFGGSAAPGASGRPTLLLATITMEFLREGRYPGSMEVATAATRAGHSSFGLAQAVFQDGMCVALADCVMVKAARGPGVGPVALTENERSALARLVFTAEHQPG
ncbi:MAG TPA: acyl-CoA thioesterase [Streptosporangiaceae bacterium]|nr:acyl-CoA thioesterase [Streptosporangiaceae bacterium]